MAVRRRYSNLAYVGGSGYVPYKRRNIGAVTRTGHFISRQSRPPAYSFGPMRPVTVPAIKKFTSTAFKRGEEIKTLDIQFTGAAASPYVPDTQPCQTLTLDSTTSTVQAINLVQQGAGISQRIGNKISLKSLRIRLSLTPLGVTYLNPGRYRFMVLYDRNPNGSYVATNNILSESLQNNTIATGIWSSSLNPNFFDRFVVLYDRMKCLPAQNVGAALEGSVGSTEDCTFGVDEFIPLKNLEVMYNGTAGTMSIAFINTGALLILCYGQANAGATPFDLQGSVRLRFHDN